MNESHSKRNPQEVAFARPTNGGERFFPVGERVPLESVLTTDELERRPSRPPRYEAENRALRSLMAEMTISPESVLQKLVETVLALCLGDSAGVSLLVEENGRKSFRWHAVAGQWSGYLGGTMPREVSPCGTVLDRNASLLFSHPERHFPFPPEITPAAVEVLLIPFRVADEPIGTIWVIAHDENRKFDAEDERVMTSLGIFASTAYQVLSSRDALKAQVADRKQAEEALRQGERRFREMIDVLPTAIYTTDAHGLLTHFNPAAVELSGRMPELGTDRWCVSWKLYHSDGTPMPHDHCPMAIALKEGRFVRDAEIILERPDGTRVWFEAHPIPLRGPGGRIVAGINMLVDITERKRSAEIIRESGERYRALFASAPVAVFVCDRNAVIQNYNRRAVELWGREPQLGIEQHCGSSKLFLPNGTFLPHAQSPIVEVLRTGIPALSVEVLIERPDGVRIPAIANFAPMRNAQGGIVGAITSFDDISERKRVEEALRGAQEQLANRAVQLEHIVAARTTELRDSSDQLESFVYSIAHDLRAPLRSMIGCSQLLVDDYAADLKEGAQQMLKRIQASSEFMDKLVIDLLDYGRTARAEIECRPLQVEKVWNAAMLQCETKIKQTHALIETIRPLPLVCAHEGTLGQCLSNLLDNALKFVKPGVQPKLSFWSEDRDEYVRLWLADNGVGIPEEQQKRVFRVFERLQSSRYAGTGIGLAIVRKGIERMGGKSGVESELSKGSRFWIELPKVTGRVSRQPGIAPVEP